METRLKRRRAAATAELMSSVRHTIDISRQLRDQLARTRQELQEQRLQQELERLTELLEKTEGQLDQLTATEPDAAAGRVPLLNRWLENVE